MPPRPRVLPPPPRVIPPASPSGNVSAAPANYSGSAAQPGPKKETARISILPEPTSPPSPGVKMAKTQPLLATPPSKPRVAPVVVTTAPKPAPAVVSGSKLDLLDAVPLPVAWTIFSISAVTLIIQIWNYLG